MGRAASLEHDRRGWLLGEERQESLPRQSSLVVDSTGAVRDGDLEHGLCEIDGDGRMLHLDSSLPWPQEAALPIGTMMPHGRRSPFHRLQPAADRAILRPPRLKLRR